MKKWFTVVTVFIYTIILLSLSVYTYSQVDLNLTISANELFQAFQKPMLQLGYFNRMQSAYGYILLLALLFSFYIFLLKITASKKTPDRNLIICLIILNILAAFISYPAFSHDFFNYMFDARIVTLYRQNPYFYRALDFPGDLWLRFMHWTHRTYPYGPLWLVTTLPFSYLGMGKFVLTLVLFKLLFILSYLSNSFLIYRIGRIKNREFALKGLIFFAFNPLIIIETLVSPHNESLMLVFLLLSFYYLYSNKNFICSLLTLVFSVLIKFVTFPLLPLYFIKKIRRNYHLFLIFAVLLLLIPLSVEVFNREAYPWYFIPLIGISSLLNITWVRIGIISLSLGALLRYVPYLNTGSYNLENYRLMNIFLILPVIIVLGGYFTKLFIKKLI